jgi:hypothetical protein
MKIYLSAAILCLSLTVAAQAPGGIGASNLLSLWIRSDVPSTLAYTDSLDNWTYYNIPANVFASSPHNRPIVQTSSFNFLPTVFFNGAQEMNGPTGTNAPITATNPSYAVFAVWSSNVSSSTPQRTWSQNATGLETGGFGDCAALWIHNGEYGDQDDISPFTQCLGLAENPGQISFVQANAAPGKHYYRILETDQNGNSIYSKVDAITILAGGDFSITVLNNPAAGNTDAQLQINAANAGTAIVELWSAAGSRIAVLQLAISTGTTTIAVPMSHLPAGSYAVKVAVNNGTQTHVVQVVKL